MRVVEYDPDAGQPGMLDDFARLEQDMIVVLKGTAYELRRGILPARPVLLQSVPNPFNSETIIPFAVSHRDHVTLDVYNMMGRKVIRLLDGELDPGLYHIPWSASSLPSGMYFCQMKAGGVTFHRKVILLK